MKRRVALFSASVGAGHSRAAEALVAAAEGSELEIVHHDILSMMPRPFVKLYRDTYLDMVNRAPKVFSWLFELTDKPFRPDAVRMMLDADPPWRADELAEMVGPAAYRALRARS